MNPIVKFLVSDFLTTPTIVIGLLILIGYLLQKAGPVKTINGTIGAMVGLQLIIFGGSQFSNVFKPIVTGVIQTFGTVWAITQLNYPSATGWSGMFDLSTFWPALIQVLRWIGGILGITI